jgi:hypothetical protein
MTTNNTENINIDALVKFLDQNDPTQLLELRKNHPAFASYFFADGITLKGGDPEKKANAQKEEDRLRAMLYLTKTSLTSVNTTGKELLVRLQGSLRANSRYQMINQIIILISSAAILGTIKAEFGKEYDWIKFIAPSLVLLSSAITIILKTRRESFVLNNQSLTDLGGKLIEHTNSALFVLDEIEVLLRYFDSKTANKAIEKANKIAADMNLICEKIKMSWIRKK